MNVAEKEFADSCARSIGGVGYDCAPFAGTVFQQVDMRVPSGYSWLLASPVSAVIDMRVSRSGSMQILSVLCILHEIEQGFQLVFARAGERREKLSAY